MIDKFVSIKTKLNKKIETCAIPVRGMKSRVSLARSEEIVGDDSWRGVFALSGSLRLQ